jgi:hypothetical protein
MRSWTKQSWHSNWAATIREQGAPAAPAIPGVTLKSRKLTRRTQYTHKDANCAVLSLILNGAAKEESLSLSTASLAAANTRCASNQ